MIICKTKSEIELMRQAGQMVGRTIEELAKYVRPGVSGLELDGIANDYIRSQGGIPAFFRLYDFPGNICISFNEEVLHGIPSRRVLKAGDIISFDVGVTYKGWNGDSAVTLPVGKVSPQIQKLLDTTQEAMLLGVQQMRLGNYIYDIGAAIQDYANGQGFTVVGSGWGGHGIGRKVHEDPYLPHTRQPTRGMALRRGMCLAVEPMLNTGTAEVFVKSDKWTVTTKDGKLSAHFEHSVAITDGEPLILTTA